MEKCQIRCTEVKLIKKKKKCWRFRMTRLFFFLSHFDSCLPSRTKGAEQIRHSFIIATTGYALGKLNSLTFPVVESDFSRTTFSIFANDDLVLLTFTYDQIKFNRAVSVHSPERHAAASTCMYNMKQVN